MPGSASLPQRQGGALNPMEAASTALIHDQGLAVAAWPHPTTGSHSAPRAHAAALAGSLGRRCIGQSHPLLLGTQLHLFMMLQPDLLTLFISLGRTQFVAMFDTFLIGHQLAAINGRVFGKGH